MVHSLQCFYWLKCITFCFLHVFSLFSHKTSGYGNIRCSLWDYFFNAADWSSPLVIRLSGVWICWWRIRAQATHHPHSYCCKAVIQYPRGIHENRTPFNPYWAKTWIWTHYSWISYFEMNTNNQWLCWAEYDPLMLNLSPDRRLSHLQSGRPEKPPWPAGWSNRNGAG